jgi:excisionase family DNA binding protein
MAHNETRSPLPVAQEFLSPVELADYLGVPVATVYGWRHFGTGPVGSKLGRHVRYRRSDVDAWVSSQSDARRAS